LLSKPKIFDFNAHSHRFNIDLSITNSRKEVNYLLLFSNVLMQFVTNSRKEVNHLLMFCINVQRVFGTLFIAFLLCATRTEGCMTAFPCPRVRDFDTFDNFFLVRGGDFDKFF